MKIAYLSTSIIPSKSANSIHVMKMCSAFSNNGHEVVLLARKAENNIDDSQKDIFNYYGVEKNFKILRFYQIKTRYGQIWYSFISVLYAKYYHFDLAYSRNLYGSLFSTLFKIKSIYEAHSPENFTKLSRFIFKRVINHNNTYSIIAISDALKNIICEDYGLVSKIIIAHDASDIPTADKMPKIFNRKMFNLGYVGNLNQGRGVDIIIELAKKLPAFIFHIIGGENDDVEHWKRNTENIKNLKFHGFIAPKDTEIYRDNCDVLLAPYQNIVSLSGGRGDTSKWMSPLKIFDYMASGKAIICSDLPVLREVLTHEQTALLCQPALIEDWESAIWRLFENQEERLKLGVAAYNEFKDKYTWSERAKKVLINSTS